MNRLAEAEPILLAALDLARDPQAPSQKMEESIMGQLVMLYDAWNKPEQASEYRTLMPATSPTTTAAGD
jgi:hypothetical protein